MSASASEASATRTCIGDSSFVFVGPPDERADTIVGCSCAASGGIPVRATAGVLLALIGLVLIAAHGRAR